MKASSSPRRCRLRTGFVFALFLVGAFGVKAEPSAIERPNILLLVAEDLSARIGAFGDAVARTPHLDRLAREGVRFPNTFTTAGVCAPSRAALILGLHAISTGTQHMRTEGGPTGPYRSVPPPEAKGFPERMRGVGYFTFQHGKLDYQFSGVFSKSGPSTLWDEEDNDAMWGDRAPDQPFFGMINFMVTHESGLFAPLGSWPRSLFHFIMQVAQTYQRWGWEDRVVPTDPAAIVLPPYYPDLPAVRTDLARHYDNVQIMDAQVGAILEALERDGLADSTIVIWTTDHGDGLPRAKRELFDSGIRVPMIIRWPEAMRPAEFTPGDRDERLISFVDLTAAMLALAHVSDPGPLAGRDFLSPETAPRRYVFAARDRIDDTPDRQRAVRDARFKYIWSDHPDLPGGHPSAFRDNLRIVRALRAAYEAGRLDADQRRWFEAPGTERLFDLEADPYELRDVSGDPAYSEPLERMRSALSAWRARVPDWSDRPEAEMAADFWPDGEQPETAPVTFRVDGDRLVLASPTPGASIALRIGDAREQLYVSPIPLSHIGRARIEAHAVRYGWAESDPTHWSPP